MQYRYRFAFILWTVWLAGLVMPGRPAAADGIVADGAAPTGQRPHVVTTQNGLPQVNIAAPDQGGCRTTGTCGSTWIGVARF